MQTRTRSRHCVRVKAKKMDTLLSSRSETILRQRRYLHTNAVG